MYIIIPFADYVHTLLLAACQDFAKTCVATFLVTRSDLQPEESNFMEQRTQAREAAL